MSTGKKITLIASLCFIGFILLLIPATLFLARSYIEGDEFRRMLSSQASQFLGVEGEFLPFAIDGSVLSSAGYAGDGKQNTPLAQVRADQIQATIRFADVFRGSWTITELKIGKLDLRLNPVTSSLKAPSAPALPKPASSFLSALLPKKVNLQRVVFEDVSLTWPGSSQNTGTLKNTYILLDSTAESWKAHGKGGILRHPGFPVCGVDYFRLAIDPPKITLQEIVLHPTVGGKLSAEGTLSLREIPSATLKLHLTGLPASEVLPSDWRARVLGNLQSDAIYQYEKGKHLAKGTVELTSGYLQGLPLLQEAATVTQINRFLKLPLDQSKARFSWTPDKLDFTDIFVESNGLLRIQGTISKQTENVTGLLEVGTSEQALLLLPGAQEQVFTTSKEGYVWARPAVHLSGTVGDIQEDLSPRLKTAFAEAVGTKVKDTVESVIDKAKTVIPNLLFN